MASIFAPFLPTSATTCRPIPMQERSFSFISPCGESEGDSPPKPSGRWTSFLLLGTRNSKAYLVGRFPHHSATRFSRTKGSSKPLLKPEDLLRGSPSLQSTEALSLTHEDSQVSNQSTTSLPIKTFTQPTLSAFCRLQPLTMKVTAVWNPGS